LGSRLKRDRVVKEANELIELYGQKISFLEDQNSAYQSELAELRHRVGVLEELVTRSADVAGLREEVRLGFSEVQRLIRESS
jgi:hypothetical protein